MSSQPIFEEITRSAWIEALDRLHVDVSLTWEEAGADSIRSLNLLLRLEKALGRKLSFDIIDADMTICELASRLAKDAPVTFGLHESRSSPTVFLVPALFGDEPILADFRRWFGSKLRFEVLDLPEVSEPSTVHMNVAQTGRAIAHEIDRRQPYGALITAGYSFGGGPAYESAQALLAKGRDVALLCILDTPLRRAAQRGELEENYVVKKLQRTLFRLLA